MSKETQRRYCFFFLGSFAIWMVLLYFSLEVEPNKLHLQTPVTKKGLITYVTGKGRASSGQYHIGDQVMFCTASAYLPQDNCDVLVGHDGKVASAQFVALTTFWGNALLIPISISIGTGSGSVEWTKSFEVIRSQWWGNTMMLSLAIAAFSTWLLYLYFSMFNWRKTE
jgi:hypothetical protein